VAEAQRDKNLYLFNVNVRKDMTHITNYLEKGAMLWHERLAISTWQALRS